ncbi:MAG: glycosyltransferase family 2 protein [Candidatus Omnitrophica bacterium]|nr:glycosyltransferase family 2 protein [Candidatus Omnitrophota bacterium]
MNPNPFISFIIPVYNEELNIARMLSNMFRVLEENRQWNWEVIIIEDGSSDHTQRVLTEEVKKYSNTQLILHERNQGYTRSLKDGIARARGRFLMYIGADEEFDCAEIPQFVNPLLAGEADIILGVRWQRNAYRLFRFFLSVIYIFTLNYLFKLRVNDYNWSQAWAKELLDRIDLRSKSLFVLPEIIIRAHDLNYRIREVPSNHRGRQFGKSSVNLQIMGHALWEAFCFCLHRNSSKYQPAARNPKHQPEATALPQSL